MRNNTVISEIYGHIDRRPGNSGFHTTCGHRCDCRCKCSGRQRRKSAKSRLHEPRKHPRKPSVKGASVDLGGDRPNDLGAAAIAIAADAVGVGGTTVVKDAGTMQKVMDQGVDGDHAFASLEPMRPTRPQAT